MLEPLHQGSHKSEILIVEGYGADIFVEHGHLVVRDGFPNEGQGREIIFPRGRCSVNRIIVRAYGGSISIAAIDWCNRMGIALAFVGSDSRLINCLTPDAPHDGPMKRAQAIVGTTDDGPRLARMILKRKCDSQICAITKHLPQFDLRPERTAVREAAVREIQANAEGLVTANSLDALLMREGRAANAYWGALAGSPLPWPAWALRRIPEHWSRICQRFSGGRSAVRDARDPFNAVLNYCYTLLEVETRVACASYGLDPDLGILHVDERLRESFIYDLLEPVRAMVDMLALDFLTSKGIRPYMFHEMRDGVVRLDPDLARPLAENLMPRMRKPVMAEAAFLTAELKRTRVPYTLVRNTARTTRYRTDEGRIPPTNPGYCEYCHAPVPRQGLKFCGRQCYLRHSVEVRQPIRLAQQRLAEMRARALNPGHGGDAAVKRGAKLAESNRRRALELTPDEWGSRRAAQQRKRRSEATTSPESAK